MGNFMLILEQASSSLFFFGGGMESFSLLFLSPLLAGTTGVSASRITEILGASSLTDEEIQQLIELLLEKSNANSEWEAVSTINRETV